MARRPDGRRTVERASAIDMMEWASATTPAAGQVGAVLVLEPGDVDLGRVRSALTERVRGVPRLRQRLRPTPLGCGRPIWVDDPTFDIVRHVDALPCPRPGDRTALLDVAADLVSRPLATDQPLWTATLVTGLADGASALVVVFHHVMADGMGGLAVLATLIDGGSTTVDRSFPRPPPGRATLFLDAMRTRLSSLMRPAATSHRWRAALTELGTRPPKAPHCSLNAPVGSRRSLALSTTSLAAVHHTARSYDVKVNDAVLAAITGALGTFLAERGETVDELVVSIPVAGRPSASAAELGNQIGVMAVALPTGGALDARMRAIGASTASRKRGARGASAELLAPAFRLLAATGTLRWFTDHQHLVNTFVTNLRGPDTSVHFIDRRVDALIPIGSTSGNVRVAFSVFSYAGTLTITIVADASLGPDLDTLARHLDAQLDALTALTVSTAPDH